MAYNCMFKWAKDCAVFVVNGGDYEYYQLNSTGEINYYEN